MNLEKINENFEKIKNILVEIAPENWSSVYVYVEMEKNSGSVMPYYLYDNELENIDSTHELWELFNEYCPILYTDDFVIEFF